ncbi:hypothetical protein [Stenotrophomonas pigmentata]|uniref:hypothetical protein n=1 Tax=Stenotrophomonas pigmentata TaxID=3055080 RepID=UPI0026F0A238|nr:hypothetical protein [Stenotrophomonas sp. 610A2]
MSTRKRYVLHGFTVAELRGELDKRRRAEGKPPHQWDELRSVYLDRRIAECREKLAELEANGSPRGYAAYIHATRINALKKQISQHERNAALAKADEKKAAEARKRP